MPSATCTTVMAATLGPPRHRDGGLPIGSATPAPQNRRMRATWISPGDVLRLVVAALTAPQVSHSIVYGMSASAYPIWDPSAGAAIGYGPRSSSEP